MALEAATAPRALLAACLVLLGVGLVLVALLLWVPCSVLSILWEGTGFLDLCFDPVFGGPCDVV
uniref:Uncharacterized protein n=1 Tax=Zea mays TaxID=4577 RepID=B6U9I0_MAIZE|nr:hypothetical protein [Zea mays]